jgi:hypothetical protein
MTLWLPPGVTREQAEARDRNNALVLGAADLHTKLEKWNRRLREIDPNLQLVKASESANHPALKPGYYHVIRHNPGGSPGIIVHEGPNGEFRDPDSGLFRELQEGDLWNDRVRQAKEKRRKTLQKAEERAAEQEREERVQEFIERKKARFNPSVRITRSI